MSSYDVIALASPDLVVFFSRNREKDDPKIMQYLSAICMVVRRSVFQNNHVKEGQWAYFSSPARTRVKS